MPSAPARLPRPLHLLIAALLATTLAVGCGVETSSDGLKDKDGGTTTTDPEAPCEDDGDIIGAPGSTGGCAPDPEPDPKPDPAPDPDPTPTPDPDPAPTGDDEDYAEALAAGLDALEDDDLPISADEADCIAPDWIDALGGAEELEAADILPEDLQKFEVSTTLNDVVDLDGAQELVDILEDCGVDLDGLLRQSGLDDGQTEEEMDCFFELLPDGAFASMLAATLAGGGFEAISEHMEAMQEAYETCMPEDFGDGAPGD